ncbi:MAG: HRDC domain-containing protein [Thermodesulfobacteriota bacterium]|nr:HRDC domain-containing protein [Thermodesulfobacteriota bacterium]
MTNYNHTEYILIENNADLERIALELQKEPAIGVDLEGDSMFHYQEKVCLLQISTHSLNIVIDPLSVGDFSPLDPIFADAHIRKVFHGADYDMRSLYRDFGIEVHSLFDTQIAAKFLGLRETGLASLLKEKFCILSNKKYQKKDWSQRPLPADMLQYAVQDICYLLPLAGILEKQLIENGRLFCVNEESELLSRVRPNSSAIRPFFLSFKGASRLDPRSLAVLEKILCFRDQVARRQDRPHFKVMGNQPIMEIVRMRPMSQSDFVGIMGLSRKQIEHMGGSLIEKIKEGLDLPEEELPVYPNKSGERLRSKEAARVKALKEWRQRIGGKTGIDPSLVCTNAQIRALAIANPQEPEGMECIKEIRKWQIKLFGPNICNVLQKSW